MEESSSATVKEEASGGAWPTAVAGAGTGATATAGVGRLVDCSQADDRRMIRLVKERRLLYARNNMPVASYYSQVKSLWEEVANEMGWSVGDVRRKWSHIRNSYSRHLRNELGGARTGRGRAVSRWYLADELDFLRDHMATDTRTSSSSSFPGYAPTFLEMDLSEGAGGSSPPDVKPDVKPFGASWLAMSGGAAGRWAPEPRQEPHSVHSDDSGGAHLPAHSFAADEANSYFQFFRGLHSDYCELSARKQRLFQRQCLAFLHELLDEEDADGEQGTPGSVTPARSALSVRYILPND